MSNDNNSRRNFLSHLGLITASTAFDWKNFPFFMEEVKTNFSKLRSIPVKQAAQTEKLWKPIRKLFTISKNHINLNNGGLSPHAIAVQNELYALNNIANEAPSVTMVRHMHAMRNTEVKEAIASIAGCSPTELAINRNTTEGINTIAQGLNLKKDDEIIVAKQDYSSMVVLWKQLEQRNGIKIKWVDLKLPSNDAKYLTNAYTSLITNKTKLVHVTHMLNWNGQVMPVAQICKAAKAKGIFTLVDGAHTFGHLNFKIPQLNCDAYATSLHKWLGGPFGTGLLYVRKNKIGKVWPLFPAGKKETNNITKFEHLGSRDYVKDIALLKSIELHNSLGIDLIEARLRYLKNYWIKHLSKLPTFKLLTPKNQLFCGGIATFTLGDELDSKLTLASNKAQIHVSKINFAGIKGIRVSPNIYNSLKDLDAYVNLTQRVSS